MQLCSDFEYHNKTSFPHRNKEKYCLKEHTEKKNEIETFSFKVIKISYNLYEETSTFSNNRLFKKEYDFFTLNLIHTNKEIKIV